MFLIPTLAMSQITLTKNNHVLFKGVVDDTSVAKASKDLLKLSFRTKPGDKIYLVLDSGGGAIYPGLDFVQLFTTIPRNVECVALKAHSMAHHFLQACPSVRHGTPNTLSMAHRAAGTFRGTFNSGDVEQQLELWTGIVQSMEKVNAKRMGLSLEKYQSLVKSEYWCHGYGCKKKNFVDTVSSITCSKELVEKEVKKTINTFFGSYNVYTSACPVIRAKRYERIHK